MLWECQGVPGIWQVLQNYLLVKWIDGWMSWNRKFLEVQRLSRLQNGGGGTICLLELLGRVNRESSVTRCSGRLVSVASLLLPLLTSPGPTKNHLIYPESDRNFSRPAHIWNYILLPHSPQAHPSTGAQPLAVLLQSHLWIIYFSHQILTCWLSHGLSWSKMRA